MDTDTVFHLCENPELRFLKEPTAAGSYLLALSCILLEGRELPPHSKVVLGQALREAALLALNGSKSAKQDASEALLKALGLKKGGGTLLLEQVARNGATNEEMATRFNIGKNQISKVLSPVVASERELLGLRLTHTIGRLLSIIDEGGTGLSTSEATERVRDYLRPQFHLLDDEEIEGHVQMALKIACEENLITTKGSTVTRNI